MTTTSTTAVGQTYLTLLRAAQLTLGPQGDDLQVGFHIAVSALQLRCLTLVQELIQIPDRVYPETIAGCLEEAAAQTCQWDLATLPPEAVDFIIDLADLKHVLGQRR
ncbi:hypothetical protein [Tessaracoccus antarcticus]|uniref:Uncharacterized protein n=1 Tax=Tessaracoccus antarcticus TaxID=2479848 RepID=A0A3M0FXM2_9ACTN|nr:hypothetical protein [Tessaracoccus antarcticus]RMB57228.1 hypothetical protein EAX62_15915 [Tessaracoccus antarcticus]